MSTTLLPIRYIILVRHASRDLESSHFESEQSMLAWNAFAQVKPSYVTKGLPRTLAIANRVWEELDTADLVQIFHSPHKVAVQTAKAYEWAIRQRTHCHNGPKLIEELDPDKGSAKKVANLARSECYKSAGQSSAIVLVGHQPMLTQVASILTNQKLPAGTLPLGGSEAACLELEEGKAATLLWMLTEKSDNLLNDLKDKIKSKYDVAKFFLGAFVVNTGVLFSSVIWDLSDWIAFTFAIGGLVLALVAIALTVATLLSYDALLMPPEFWTDLSADPKGEQRARPKKWSVLRPPSQAHVVLFYEMVHVWNSFFLPALYVALTSIAAIMIGLAHGRFNALVSGKYRIVELLALTIIAGGAVLAPLAIHYRQKRPKLGFED